MSSSSAWTSSGKNGKAANFDASYAQGPTSLGADTGSGTTEAWVRIMVPQQTTGTVLSARAVAQETKPTIMPWRWITVVT